MRFTSLSPTQDRALHELRQGRPLRLRVEGGATFLCWAIDTSTDALDHIPLCEDGFVLLSAPRAQSLGYSGAASVALPVAPAMGSAPLRFLMQSKVKVNLPTLDLPSFADPLLLLAKQGRLIPAFYICPMQGGADLGLGSPDLRHSDPKGFDLKGLDLIDLNQGDLALTGPAIAPQRISTVPIPLHVADQHMQVTATLYKAGPLGEEPLALCVGDPYAAAAPLVRLHSACLTGDVFGSLRCDCGPQLHQALAAMNAAGQGCLLYLPQEGRDTGLHNKLRAYALQDVGLDTVDADATLGFEPDERDFAMAAALLNDLGLTSLRLLTNNPAKVAGLEAQGIQVMERVPLQIPAQEHNHAYLKTKAVRAGHHLPHS